MRLINVTPHDIMIITGDDRELVFLQSGTVARLETIESEIGSVDGGIPIIRVEFGDITGLPDPEPGALYVASTLVAQAAAARGRRDVVAPDTGRSAIRNKAGDIIAVRRLQAFWR